MSNKRAAQVTWSTDKDTQGIKPVYRRTGNDMILKSRGALMSDWGTQKPGHVHITNGMSQYGANHSADIHIDGRDMASVSQKK